MRIIQAFFTVLIMLVHLQSFADEPINIKLASQPVITVTITTSEVAEIKNQLSEKASAVLGLYMVVGDTPASVPVSGRYSLAGKRLSFTPMYALGNNIEFEVVFRSVNKINTRRFKTPGQVMPDISTHVVTAYPTCDTIPYNTLFFHIRFSQPMMQDVQAYKYVHVYDDRGTERTKAWRQRSFWLDSGRLLVLMIHPGRVKNGIHYEGPLFDSGRYYKLVVNKDIKNEYGNTIVSAYEQSFFVTGEDRISPVPELNYNKLPQANTKMPLILSFNEGMDYASIFEGAKLYDGMGVLVDCKIAAEHGDRVFSMVPGKQWKKGNYTLVLKAAVYDFAANRINRLFEITDPNEMEKDKIETKLSFQIN